MKRKAEPVDEGDGAPVKKKSKNELQCTFCDGSFTKQKHLTRHLRKHTGEKFACELCGADFTRAEHLRRHTLTHSEERPFACDFQGCGSAFKTRDHLKRHQKKHKQKKAFKCEVCGESFKKKKQLRKHNKASHGIAASFPCAECDESFPSQQDRKKHVKAVHAEPGYPCDDCDEKFRWFRDLTKHRRLFHGCVCRICNRQFTSKKFLLLHYDIHLQCKVCGEQFSSPEEAVTHQLETRHEIDKYVCTVPGCGRRFAYEKNRDAHVKTHDSEFNCEQCDSTFKWKRSLEDHEKKHEEGTVDEAGIPMSLVCKDCGKVCKNSHGLGVHRAFKHTTVQGLQRKKPRRAASEGVECEQCGLPCKSPQGLAAHRRLKHAPGMALDNARDTKRCGPRLATVTVFKQVA